MSRGRKHVIPPLALQTILDKYREEIYDESTGKAVPKAHKIWETISTEVLEETGIVKTAKALYTHVTCRKVFSKQRPTKNVAPVKVNLDNSVKSEANTSAKEDTHVIHIHFSQKKFEEIIGKRDYNDRKTKSGKRNYDVFLEGKWEHAMTELLWKESRIACGFQYSRGRLYRNNTATIHGKCKCGMKIECVVSDTKRDPVIVTCILSGKSQGQCSRRPLRNPQRDDLGKQMLETGKATSKIYRKNEAPNRIQLNWLVEALQLNPEVAKGMCPKALKRKKFKDFSIELNALGPPQKKWNEWFKAWIHWKKELLKKSVCPPGRPLNPNVHLTGLEQTIIQLIYSSKAQTQASEFEPDELLYEEESDLNSESDEDEVQIIETDDDEESFDISKEPFDPSALALGFVDPRFWQNEPTSSTNVQPENSDTLALHEIKSEEEEVVEQNIQRYDSSESLEGHVEEFLNMKDELQTIKNCHQKILQDQISSEKDFHSKVLNFMGEIKTSMENIESHLKMNLERNDALIALKKEKVEDYRQAKEDKLADKQAKLQLQFQLLDIQKRKLDNLIVKKES